MAARFARLVVPVALALLALVQPAAAAGTGYVFISHERSDAVVVLDPETYAVVATIPTSGRPRDMAFSPDRTLLYVACGQDNVVEVIDVARLAIVDAIPTGRNPEMVVVSADGTTLYVANEDESTVEVIDIATKRLRNEIVTGAEPEGLALGRDGRFLYIASEITDLVHVVDLATGRIAGNIIVGTRPRRLALTADGAELWVTDELSGSVSVVDLATNTVAETIRFNPPGVRSGDVSPVAILVTPDGSTMVVGLGYANHVAFIDVRSREVSGYVLVGNQATGLGIGGDGRILYVVNAGSDGVSVVDMRTRRNIRSIATGRVPHSVVVDG